MRRLSVGFMITGGVIALVSGAGCGSERDPMEELRLHLPVTLDANILVISFDALRNDALGVYGHPLEISPNLDAFASQSVVFDNAYTVAPVTPTSFAAVFTGLLPTRVFHAWELKHDDTLAGRFKQEGYTTAAFINNLQLVSDRHFDTGFEHYVIHRSVDDEVLVNGFLEWIRSRFQDKFFAWVHFLSPHAPYDVFESSAHLYDDDYSGAFQQTSGPRFETDDPTEINRLRSLYDGEVYRTDALFGRIAETLDELGLLDSTIVVVTSDHGEEFAEHGGFQHDRLTEEHVRIPLLIRHPHVRAMHRSPLLVSNVDLFPTLLSIAGLDPGGPTDGRDLINLASEPDTLVGVSMTGAKNRWLSIRRGRHKLILQCLPEVNRVLYDLQSDPQEMVDRSGDRPQLSMQLEEHLGAILGGDPCTVMQSAVQGADATVGLTPENIEALKALGYLSD